jgi:hypothetical protein
MRTAIISFISIMLYSACVERYEVDPLRVDRLVLFDQPVADLHVFADGTSHVNVGVTLDVDAEQQVTFVTEQGSFTGNGVSADKKSVVVTSVNKKASATLVADQTPNSEVPFSASISTGGKSYASNTKINFVAAAADTLYLSVDKLEVKADKSSIATFSVNATREVSGGKTSDGLKIDIHITTTDGLAVDYFPFVRTTGTSDLTPITFTVKSLNATPGDATVTVTTTKQNGKPVSATRVIKFIP